MKGKIRILGHAGLALFLACTLALALAVAPAAPVQAATEVTDVWVEFPGDMSSLYADNSGLGYTGGAWTYTALDDGDSGLLNKANDAVNMIVHFTATTALKANIDTITIYFPDGSTAMSGSDNSSGTFDLSSASVGAGSQLVCVDPDGSGSTYGYYDITTAATAAGYRLKLTTPIDIAAGASPYIFIAESAVLTTSSVAGHAYKIKVQTSNDTSLVLSSAFSLGATSSDVDIDTGDAAVFVPLTVNAGSATQFTFGFNASAAGALTAGSSKITIIFPAGTGVPTSIAADQIECQYYTSDVDTGNGASGYQQVSGTVTVNSDARMVTITAPVSVANSCGYQVRFKTGAGITMPQVITSEYVDSTNYDLIKYYIYTSVDRYMKAATTTAANLNGNFKISPGAAYKLGFNNDAYYGNVAGNTYSADCAIINGFTNALYLQMQDQYGNLIYSGTGSAVTVTLGTTTGGAVYTAQNTANSTGSQGLTAGEPSTDLYFRATTAGTHTITASSGSYTSATWQVTVAPAVSLYDPSGNLVNTYAPLSTDATHSYNKGGYYVNQAVSAAMAGDTIKLGEGIYDVTSNSITLDKAVTIEAVSGTTPILRRTGTGGGVVSVSKGATLDGLTFRGLRWTSEYDSGFINIHPTSTTGPTIKNCIFEDFKCRWGAILWQMTSGGTAVTSGAITNNTFQNLVDDKDGCPAVVYFESEFQNVSGVTVSDNIFLNNTAIAITVTGSSASATSLSFTDFTISGNTMSSDKAADVAIDICNWGTETVAMGSAALPIKIINNEISGCQGTAIRLQEGAAGTPPVFSASFPGVRIKRNYIHDNAGSAIELIAQASASTSTTANIATAVEIMYNDIVDNAHTSGTYGIYNNLADKSATVKVTAQYNWFGDASGPTVTANVGGTGDTVATYVVYSPWLYKSRTDVVADNVSYSTGRMNLVSGWNTLSTPVKLIDTANSIDELISADDMVIGYWYDANDADSDGAYWEQITTGYVLSPCNAVYIEMSTTASPLLKFDAGVFTTPSKDLYAGWNLISLAYLNSAGKYEKSAVASVALTAAGLPGYSQVVSPSLNAAQTDLFGTSGSSWTYSYGEHDTTGISKMYAGLGYWIYMQNAATLAGFTITPIVPDLD